METDKRNFSDFSDKKHFPGFIDEETGEYHFPTLYRIDSNDNTRVWNIKIRLIKDSKEKNIRGINWDLLRDETVHITEQYIKDGIPKGTISQVWTETGIIGGKITRHSPTYPKPTNVGRANERNYLEQAMVTARSLYLKKIETGFSTNKNKKEISSVHTKYFPMLVRKYEDEMKHMKYPLYVQPKLDGVRCLTFLNTDPKNNPNIDNVIMYSRQRKDYIGFDEMKKELLPVLVKYWDNGSIYIDGELYKHGMNLQTISGAVRNPERETKEEYKGLQYWIYDTFYPSKQEEFKDRVTRLHDMEKSHELQSDNIIITKTDFVKDIESQEYLYNQYIKKKYEGVIIRNADSYYLTDSSKTSAKIRSRFVLKRKAKFTDEFEVIGFTQGDKGKDKGAIIWILKTKNSNKEFHATPKNISYDARYELYNEAKKYFDNKFNGRLMTIEFEDLSYDGVPLRAKSIGFRNNL